MGEVVLFIPRPNPSRKPPPAFDTNHYHLDQADILDTAPCEMPPAWPSYQAPDSDPA